MEEEAREYKVQWSESGQAVIFDADTVMRLRKDHRIVGALEGSHPIKPLQNLYFGLPLILLPEETALLVETGVITPDPGISLPWPSTSREKVLFALYKDMHKRGYYITRGLKFGGEYLLYPGETMRYHSNYIVSLVDSKTTVTPRELIALSRLGTAVKKTRILCSWDADESKFVYVTMNWSAFG